MSSSGDGKLTDNEQFLLKLGDAAALINGSVPGGSRGVHIKQKFIKIATGSDNIN